ncbi:TolC family protein [Christiangramia sp. SM2212]|uniref:TolC family protein n=1 Tax=Christiangramia sediminicola TaxID=3073267 RepID=A0ABU1ER65_9FLAO|nr:TolC family protein [Christiangramia sp. SM2212]MDR5590522.1 TolC family protein [Christiangramia sp. SM2212]
MRKLIFFLMTLTFAFSSAQEQDSLQLEFGEYMAIVKNFHPLVKQAGLVVDEGEFKLMKARGAFDPKIAGGFSNKEFKGTEYYSLFDAAFKIPTYYGLEFNAKFEDNGGYYLNPQNTVPEDGLFSAGVNLDITNGLWMSERMASLKQAKIYREQTKAKRDIAVANVIYNAVNAYFEWYATYQELELYERFLDNAEFRLESVKTSFRAGDMPAVDTLEANTNYRNRKIQYQQAQLDYTKSSLNLSNYLWTDNDVPVEITENVFPDEELFQEVDQLWIPNELNALEDVENNPKIRSLEYDLDIRRVERDLMGNKLLPNIDLTYNFLTSEPREWRGLNTADYKFGLKLELPIFLRKERGNLQLAKVALENTRFELISASREIENKIQALQTEIASFREQLVEMNELVDNYDDLVSAEVRLFQLGDSSLFLVNNRENSFISAKLKEISLQKKYLKSRAELKKITANF